MSSGATWATTAERGSVVALCAMAWLYRRFGRAFATALLTPIATYFLLRDRTARRASLQYLRQLHASPEGRPRCGREPGWLESLRHFREFAIHIFDRLCVWAGGADQIEIRDEGSEQLFRLAREGRGAILLGAHLGSFDMLRGLSERQNLKVNVVMFSRHVAKITAFFERLHPGARLRVIQVEPGSVQSIFAIKACIDRGEFVGILGDRVGPGEVDRVATASFLGRPTRFPLGPFLLAARLGCPVLLTLCLRTGDARYQTVVKPLRGGEAVSRAERAKCARELLEAYVLSLEQACRRAPLQWFNFYEFWDAGRELG